MLLIDRRFQVSGMWIETSIDFKHIGTQELLVLDNGLIKGYDSIAEIP